MKKNYQILAVGAVALIVVGTTVYVKTQITADQTQRGSAVSIIGGTDGPTSIFLAGRLGGDTMAEYKTITMDDAKEIFSSEGAYVILDVRGAEEFAQGHIPGAVNIANEDIGTDKPKGLSDLDQVIYVYCRSGRRSQAAAEKLAAIGYTNIVDCGGILDWKGEIEK